MSENAKLCCFVRGNGFGPYVTVPWDLLKPDTRKGTILPMVGVFCKDLPLYWYP